MDGWMRKSVFSGPPSYPPPPSQPPSPPSPALKPVVSVGWVARADEQCVSDPQRLLTEHPRAAKYPKNGYSEVKDVGQFNEAFCWIEKLKIAYSIIQFQFVGMLLILLKETLTKAIQGTSIFTCTYIA